MSLDSLISSSIPFDQDGKHVGRLAVPQSTNSAGWANEFIPIAVIQQGTGPTAILFGGNHGDEYEGPVTLMKLARQLQPSQVSGRVIIVPMLNRPAVVAGTRLSPLDGVNMNRAFPGQRDDTITGMIAHYVSSALLPLADLVVDIHSGGSSMHMLPSVNMHQLEAKEQMKKMLAAGVAWGAPYVFIYRDVAGEGLLPSYAEAMGKVTLGTEMGSKAQFGVNTLKITELGVQRVLNWAGILQTPPVEPVETEPQIVAADDVRDYVMAPRSGILEPVVELGDDIAAGQLLARIHDPELPFEAPLDVIAETSGLLFARRAIPLTRQGECVATIVRPQSPGAGN